MSTQSVVPGDVFLYGADYNPEQWDRQTWREDVRLMKEAGVNLVSLGIWSWAALEPEPGHFTFEWFDEIVALLTEAGINIDLATPTCAVPSWFYRAHPEAMLMHADGTLRYNGSRGICCPHSPAYAQAAARITEALAAHVAGNPHITMWHVHNEYGAPDGECHCPTSQAAFRNWLRERYGSLENLNRTWGTAFWGQIYGDWEEITTPRRSGTTSNPSCELDFKRFTNESLIGRYEAERAIIARHCPGVPVTTNFMATNCPANDYWRWAEAMGGEDALISTDYYLEAAHREAHIWLAMESDLTRSLASGKPWVLMEHSVSGVSWQPHNWAKVPGEERRNALAHMARGADGIMTFQWRQSRQGAEKFHSAMVPHAGEHTRVFREVCEVGRDLATLAPLRHSRVEAKVAIAWDWESFWAQDLPWRPSILMKHREQMRRAYEWLWAQGTTVDFVHPEGDLSRYEVLIAPASYLLSEVAAENISAFIRRGGRFATLPFFSVVDPTECVHDGGAPGPMREALGLDVEEIRPIREGDEVSLVPAAAGVGTPASTLTARIWSEDLRLHGAEPVWVATGGPTPGPAITAHRYGQGLAVYVSVLLEPEDLGRALQPLLACPIARPRTMAGTSPRHVEAVRRIGEDGRSWLILINHSGQDEHLSLAGTDLLSGAVFTPDSPATLPAGGVIVLTEEQAGE